MNVAADNTVRVSRDCDDQLTTLLLAAAQRDKAAFGQLYNATVDRVLGLVTRIVGSCDVAEEVAADVYLQLWRTADRFDPARGNAAAWLMTISRSRALDAMRRSARFVSDGEALLEQAPDVVESATAQDLLQSVEQKSALHRALALLEPTGRQLIALAYFRGYSHSALSEMTGLPLGTVKTTIRRNLKKLKELLQNAEDEYGESST